MGADAVVISVDAVVGQYVSSHLLEWHSLSLIGDFLLLDENGNLRTESPIRGESQRFESFLAELGVHTVTLLVVRSSTAVRSAQDELAVRLRAAAADPTSTSPFSVRCLNVLCPQRTPPTDEEWSTCTAAWDANLIIGAEDRVDERAVTAVDDSLELVGARAALAVALISELAVGTQGLEIDALRAPGGAVRLVRAFGRLVIGPPGYEGTIRKSLEEVRTRSDMMASFVHGLPSKEPQRLLDESASSFVRNADGGALAFHRYERPAPPKPTVVTWRQAIHLVWRYATSWITGKVASLTVGRVEQYRREVLTRANGLLFGDHSEYALVPTDGSKPIDPNEVAELTVANSSADGIVVQPRPNLWRDLRVMIFSFVDGDSRPDYLPSATFNDQPFIIAEPEKLAPWDEVDSNDTSPNKVVVPRPCDALYVLRLRKRLSQLDPVKKSVESRVEADSCADGDSNAMSIDMLDRWEQARQGALTYLIAKSVAKNVLDAEAAVEKDALTLSAAVPEIKDQGPESSETKKARSAHRHHWARTLTFAFVAFALLVAPAIASFVGAIALVAGLVLEAIVLIGVVGRVSIKWLRRLQRDFQETHRLHLEAWEVEQVTSELLHDSQELLRLSNAYEELLAWSDAIARFLRSPISQQSSQPPTAVSVSLDPLALSVADATSNLDIVETVTSEVATHLFHPGWLGKEFIESSENADDLLRARHGSAAHEAGLEADYDVGAMREEARQLLDVMVERGLRRTLDPVMEQLFLRPPPELLEPVVTNRRTGHTSDLCVFLRGIEASDSVTPFDSEVCNAHSDGEIREVEGKPREWGLDADAPGLSTAAKETVLWATWRLDWSVAAEVGSLRQVDSSRATAAPAPDGSTEARSRPSV